jgi:hypothetical protein
LASYALGKTDKFKGTGVWSMIEFEREKKDDKKPEAEPVQEKTKISK